VSYSVLQVQPGSLNFSAAGLRLGFTSAGSGSSDRRTSPRRGLLACQTGPELQLALGTVTPSIKKMTKETKNPSIHRFAVALPALPSLAALVQGPLSKAGSGLLSHTQGRSVGRLRVVGAGFAFFGSAVGLSDAELVFALVLVTSFSRLQ